MVARRSPADFGRHGSVSLMLCPQADSPSRLGQAGRWTLLLVLLLPAVVGCQRGSAGATRPGPTDNTSAQEDQLIQSLADNLNHLEEFEPDQILPQIRHRLDQWVEEKKPTVEWQRDPLVETLPAELRTSRSLKALDSEKFTDVDMLNLREAVWLRDIARSARGNQLDDLSIARQLFDWTIRNLQLEDEPAVAVAGPRRFAHEVLQVGKATARERAWIFLLLLRQQGLDGVMLGIPDDKRREIRQWAPALVTDDDLYVFDAELGLPISGPEGRPVATLAELAADDALLRKLDLSSQRPYPLTAGDVKNLVAYVEASPSYLSRRMKLIGTKLTGQNKIVLSCSPEQTAKRLAGCPLIKETRYWTAPFEVLHSRAQTFRPDQAPAWSQDLIALHLIAPLRRARALQFKGAFDGEKGAKAYYLKARRSDDNLARARMQPQERAMWMKAKQDASYWLGIIAFEEQNYSVATDYFARRTLEIFPGGPWTGGAHYNLARTYEQSDQLDRAIDLYQSDSSPQKHGNRLRARRLKAQIALAGKADTAAKSNESPAVEPAE